MTALRDLSGLSFGRWTVETRGPNNPNGAAQWWCLCSCGNRVLVYSYSLIGRKTHSCGCHRSEVTTQRNQTHGMAHLPEYATWTRMIDRCTNPKNPKYANYGGRGITICEAWRTSFPAFYADIGPRPSPEYSLERIDNNGNYLPTNTVWATQQTQARNKRTTHMLTHKGTTQSLIAWAEELPIHHRLIRRRVNLGWSDERALTTPPRPVRSRKKDTSRA